MPLINRAQILDNTNYLATQDLTPLKDFVPGKGPADKGILFTPDDDFNTLITHLNSIAVIAMQFETFNDGRCYSYAKILKERHNFSGELRAVGNILYDQLNYLARCGFDTFDIADDKFSDDFFNAFKEFTVTYQ